MKGDRLDRDAIKTFTDICVWTYQVWRTRKIVFDSDEHIESFKESMFAGYLRMLSIITHEYALQQVAMLHDPAVQGGKRNLTVDHVVRFGGWEPRTLEKLVLLQRDLDGFAELIRDARNKLLAHIDLQVALDDTVLGAFPDNADEQYFERLQQFVDLINGGPYPLEIAMECNDAEMFAASIVQHTRDWKARRSGIR
jgi:hypothetical protein